MEHLDTAIVLIPLLADPRLLALVPLVLLVLGAGMLSVLLFPLIGMPLRGDPVSSPAHADDPVR